MVGIIPSLLTNFAAACAPGTNGSFLGLPTWYKYIEKGPDIAGKCSPVLDVANNPAQVGLIVLAIIELLLRLGGIVAVVFVIYGGFRYITSQGEPENTKAALSTIINALIGVGITVVATVVVGFVARSLS